MIHHQNWFYWYGENKEKTSGVAGIWNWGLRFYRSEDLYNWEDLGLVIPPDLNDPGSPLHPAQYTDRPHIVHNPMTGKFICWIKVMAGSRQTRSVLVADNVLGPYRLLARDMTPVGMSAGDFDSSPAPMTGRATCTSSACTAS